MFITRNTTTEQVTRRDICKAYEILEQLDQEDEIGCSIRVRNGSIVRIDFYLRQGRAWQLVDLPALDNNPALAYQRRNSIGDDNDQANCYSLVKSMVKRLEQDFGSHRAIKLQALQEILS